MTKTEFRQRKLEQVQKYNKTKKGVISVIYNKQKQSSKTRGHALPDYPRQALLDLALATPLFHELHTNWTTSGYDKDLKPSYDRDNPNLPYTLDNLVLMTWEENNRKAHDDRTAGIDNQQNIAVDQFTLDEEYIATHHSMAHASRLASVTKGKVSMCCAGKRISAGGFKWKYAS